VGGLTPPKLPARFVLHGVVGRGSQAVVWLATDTLRGERVALKVFTNPGPGAEARLRREVRAASVVRADTALLPHDVHAFDGGLALSMPFHPGRTLADRVQEAGPLPPEQVRALAVRLTAALAAAHGAGVLHRDVSPNNVLCSDDPRDAVLADFGSSRPLGATTTRSAMGTLGYVAPEVLSGGRADVRSDLYGLGATLYLAATGRPASEGGLAAQLSGRVTPVDERVPGFPGGLAALIGALLQADPDLRPDGAALVGRWLQGDGPATAPATASPGAQFLPGGRFAVWVEERARDRKRRTAERRRAREAPPATVMDELSRWGRHLADRVRDNLGVPPATPATPEDRLVAAVAAEASVPALRPSPLLLRKRFRLVAAVDRPCAERLAEASRLAGFQATVVEERSGWGPTFAMAALWALALAAWGMVALGAVDALLAVALTVAAGVFGGRIAKQRNPTDEGPPAYDVDLSGALTGAASPKFPRPEAPRALAPAPKPAPATRGERLRAAAQAALDALAAAAAANAELPAPYVADVTARVRELSTEAATLAARVDALVAELTGHGAASGEVDRLLARRDRLVALRGAGESVSADELAALERALAQRQADEDAAAEVESQLARATAQLVEIASTASRLRRELAVGGEAPGRSVTDELRRHADAMRRAARES
jgi:hypothetical protein